MRVIGELIHACVQRPGSEDGGDWVLLMLRLTAVSLLCGVSVGLFSVPQ